MRLVITFPDFRGEHSQEFGERLAAAYPEAVIAPILNGPDQAMLRLVAERLEAPFWPVVVKGQGLLLATLEGYEALTEQFPDHTIVKIDTAEHPIQKIETLAKRAENIAGFVVGDLEFDERTLVTGTPDWYVHLHTFPLLYGLATKGKLSLSCAHGFQAFGPGVCKQALTAAKRILAEIERQWGSMPRFGLDGAMALACSVQGISVERIGIPAITLRNRDAAKIDEQTRAHMQICLAGTKIFL
jgi:hypothetical protein